MEEIFLGNNLDFPTLREYFLDEVIQLFSTAQRSTLEVQLKAQSAENTYTSDIVTLQDLNESKIERLLAEHEMLTFAVTSATHTSYFMLYRVITATKFRTVECIKCCTKMQCNSLQRHMKICNADGSFCYICKTTFIDFDDNELQNHISRCGVVEYTCSICKLSFNTARARSAHSCESRVEPCTASQSALNGMFRMIEIIPASSWDFEKVFDSEKQHIINIVTSQLDNMKALKFFLSAKLGMQKMVHDTTTDLINFRTSSSIILISSDIEKIIANHIEILKQKIDEFLRCGSGYIVNSVKVIHLNLTKYAPLFAGSWLPLPKSLRKSAGLLNIRCSDEKCFIWNCLAMLHPYPYEDGLESEASYYQQFEHEINQTGLSWPITLNQISRFERLNNAYQVSVIAWEKGDGFYPIYISENERDIKVVMLLIGGVGRRHYVLVRNLNQLLNCKNTHYFCVRCFHGFLTEQALTEHSILCKTFPFQVIRFPEDDHLQFKSFRKTVYLPCYIVLDLESILPQSERTESSSRTSFMQDHIICGFAYKIVTDFESFKKPVQVYRGVDAAEQLVLRLHEEYEFLHDLLHADEPMKPLTASQQQELQEATLCHICGEEFQQDELKVADHCHYRGDFLGASHSKCNLERRTDKMLRVITHNFSAYDCHLFVKELCHFEDNLWHVQVIPKTLEKYTSVSTSRFRFLDSYQHMPASLEKLASNLINSGDLHYLREFVQNEYDGEEEKFRMLCRKQVGAYYLFIIGF